MFCRSFSYLYYYKGKIVETRQDFVGINWMFIWKPTEHCNRIEDNGYRKVPSTSLNTAHAQRWFLPSMALQFFLGQWVHQLQFKDRIWAQVFLSKCWKKSSYQPQWLVFCVESNPWCIVPILSRNCQLVIGNHWLSLSGLISGNYYRHSNLLH